MIRQPQFRIAVVIIVVYCSAYAHAGFVLTSLNLRSSVAQTTFPAQQDVDRITAVTNPLVDNTSAMVGPNVASSNYDFSWIESLGVGDFNTAMSHAMRNSLDIRTVTRVDFFINTNTELLVTVDGEFDYAHTPNDQTEFFFAMAVRDIDTLDYAFIDTLEGGNADLLPSSGTLTINGEATLLAGRTYLFSAVLDADNLAESDPGIYDASGFANFSIRPVPEPNTAIFILLTASLSIRRRR